MSFNLHIFIQVFALLLVLSGILVSAFVAAYHNWWPLRLLAAYVCLVLAACFMALLIP